MGTYVAPPRPTKFCHACGQPIDAEAVVCPRCGVMQSTSLMMPESEKRILPAFILCFALGVFGVHRFYVGKTGTGILQLLTFGGLGVWWLIDMIMIVVGSFTDAEGNRITDWT
jgi:TM2 domain-containing membrane protein YozV